MNLWWGESNGENFGQWGGFLSITEVGKTLSSGFILKIILFQVAGLKCIPDSLGVYKLQIFYYAQRVS